jgi:phage replication-related protein YjqB (UPF0714/DUF867 family)
LHALGLIGYYSRAGTSVPDKYCHFAELNKHEKLGSDYQIRLRRCTSATVIIAPHGGKIEPGTSEIAEAIAGSEFSFYAFEGIKEGHNGELHITSTRFDETAAVHLVSTSAKAIAIHGENSQEEIAYLGGLDLSTLRDIERSLRLRGFAAMTHSKVNLQGRHPSNICNRTMNGSGVQLELSKGLRRSFFRSLSDAGRKTTTKSFWEFVAAVRGVIG